MRRSTFSIIIRNARRHDLFSCLYQEKIRGTTRFFKDADSQPAGCPGGQRKTNDLIQVINPPELLVRCAETPYTLKRNSHCRIPCITSEGVCLIEISRRGCSRMVCASERNCSRFPCQKRNSEIPFERNPRNMRLFKNGYYRSGIKSVWDPN